jgi:serine/threonine protein phosphatase PrpC
MKPVFKTAGASVRGTSHIKNNIPCQDKVYRCAAKNTITISLADGAGSCSMSEIGADISTQFVADYLCENFDKIYTQDSDKTIEILLSSIKQLLTRKSEDLNVSLKEFSSTLLFVSVKNGNYIAGHIGDGLIGCYLDGNPKVLSFPENGEYSNQTYFTTSETAKDHLRIYKGELSTINGFILMSDGSYDSLFDKSKKKLALANETFFSWMKDSNNSQQKVEEALSSNLESLFTKATTDDCSVNLLLISYIDELPWHETLLNKIKGIFSVNDKG